MEEVKCYWEIPNIVHFCHLLRPSLKLPPIDFETLERALTWSQDRVQWENKTGVDLVDKILQILLEGYFYEDDVNDGNLEHYLKRIIEIEWVSNERRPNPLIFKQKDDDGLEHEILIGFHQLPLRSKVEILYRLCEYRLLAPDSSDVTGHLEASQLRLKPIGHDSRGYVYWYFHGTRLYRESPKTAQIIRNRFKKPVKDASEESPDVVPFRRKPYNRRVEYQPIAKVDSFSCSVPLVTTCDVPLPLLKEAWCLICSSLPEWTQLADNLLASKIETDRALGQKLADEYVPKVQKLWDKKEKAERKEILRHTLELIPRRTSSRLESKQMQKEEQEKRAQEEMEKQNRVRAEADERRKRSQRLNGSNVPIVNGNVELSPHETRLKARFREITSQETNKLAAENFHGPDNEFYQGLSKVITTVMSNRDSWPFRDPVEEGFAPKYYEIIEHPIDLSMLKRKVKTGAYSNFEEVESDFKLLVNNCERYNGPRNKYTAMSHSIWNVFKKAAKYHMDVMVSLTDETVFLIPDHEAKRCKFSNAESKSSEYNSEPNLSISGDTTDAMDVEMNGEINGEVVNHVDTEVDGCTISETTGEDEVSVIIAEGCDNSQSYLTNQELANGVEIETHQNSVAITDKLNGKLIQYGQNVLIDSIISNEMNPGHKESPLTSADGTRQTIYILWNSE